MAFNDAFAYELLLTCNETSSKLEVLVGSYINGLYALLFVPLCCEKINVLWAICVPCAQTWSLTMHQKSLGMPTSYGA